MLFFFKPLTPEPARGTAAETKTCLEISSTIVEEISKQVLVSAAVPLAGSGVSGLKKNSMVAVSVKHNYFN